jgi:POT family proton-dependent oligopeptide transporter
VLDPGKALATYTHVFQTIGLWGAGAGVLLLALSPWLKHWAHGVDDTVSEPAAARPLAATASAERP